MNQSQQIIESIEDLMFLEGVVRYVPDQNSNNVGQFQGEGDRLIWTKYHPELVRDALNKWKGSATDFAIHSKDLMGGGSLSIPSGSGKKMRAEVASIIWELKHNGRRNPKVLYRGANHIPDGVTPWSSRKRIAIGFARKNNGNVYVLPKGAGNGIRISDYGLRDEESEWIIVVKSNKIHLLNRD